MDIGGNVGGAANNEADRVRGVSKPLDQLPTSFVSELLLVEPV